MSQADNRITIAYFLSDINSGGVNTVQAVIVKGIDRRRFKAVVVVCGSGVIGAELAGYADEFYNLNVGSFPKVRKLVKGKVVSDNLAWLKLIIWICRSFLAFKKWLKIHKPDIIHSHIIHYNFISGLCGKLSGIPSVWHIHNSQRQTFRRGGPFLVEGYLASKLASCFIAVSRYTAETFHSSWSSKTKVVYNRIDTNNILSNQQKGRLRKLAKANDNDKLVGVVGIVQYRKGFDRFVEAAGITAKKMNNVKFVIVGPANSTEGERILEQLKERVKQLGIQDRFTFAGGVENACYCVGDMDVFFMCSRPDAEALPMVVIEAMAAGVPIVGFDSFSMDEIVQDGKTGFLIPDGNLDKAAERITELLSDQNLADKFKNESIKRAKSKFDVSGFIENIEKLYLQILDKKIL